MANNRNTPWSMQHNYLTPIKGVIRILVLEYQRADEATRKELSRRSPDLDLPALLKQLEESEQS